MLASSSLPRSPEQRMVVKKLKVLFVRPTLGQGGADRVTVTVLKHLDRHVFEPHLALLRAEGARIDELPGDVTLHVLGRDRVRHMGPELIRRIREVRPDIVFSMSSGTNAIAIVASRLAGCHVVVSERSVVLNGGLRPASAVQWFLKAVLYRFADGITAVNHGVARDISRKLALPAHRIRALLNPVVGPGMAEQCSEPVDHPWLGQGNKTILSVGRLVPVKGHAVLVKAFAHVRAVVSESRLIILGEGPQKERLVSLVDELGLSDSVAFEGYLKNPYAYMSKAAVFALTSRNEGLPNALIEAMACGCPVVATNCPPGMDEVITHGLDGFLAAVGDYSSIANHLIRILDDRVLAKRLSQQAQASARRYMVDAVVRNYERALLDAWGGKLGAAAASV